jgi:hypothetical protein
MKISFSVHNETEINPIVRAAGNDAPNEHDRQHIVVQR